MPQVEPIAVIGMGCRFPAGIGSPDQLWELLSEGRSGLTEVPADRWNAEAFYHPNSEGREAISTKKGHFLTHDVSEFDARFFGFSSIEADHTDPQQRLLLETTYEALENAGIPIEDLRGSDTSVFVSVFTRDYERMAYKDLTQISKYQTAGTGEAILANRISYNLDLRGGSMILDTGCSGGLVAVHQACLSLRAGESRIAIVGGTQLLLHPDMCMTMSASGMMNPEGQCFTFDSRGVGYGRGEGVGTVILKRLSHAIEDGDAVHAVILNSALNQDGKTAGITLPNPDAQAALIKHVYESANLDPAETLYVEAHGTGTQAGDTAEIESISKVFCEDQREHSIFVGSVKANIGHLEGASGIAGLIKAVMVLKRDQIPPQYGFVSEKPGLNLKERKIKVPTELSALAPDGHIGPRRVSLNSFGYGGTNAHLILESYSSASSQVTSDCASTTNGHCNGHTDSLSSGYGGHTTENGIHNGPQNGVENGKPEVSTNGLASGKAVNGKPTHTDGNTAIKSNGHVDSASWSLNQLGQGKLRHAPLLFPLTARSESALTSIALNIHQWLADRNTTIRGFRDLSYTLSCRRSRFRWRSVVVAADPDDLSAKLATTLSKTRATASHALAFVFTGQGAQWHAMGRELIATSSCFRDSVLKSDRSLRQLGCDWSLLEELNRPEPESRVGKGEISQPATTAIQIALVDLFASFGITPSYVVGHSSGEIAGAYAAGALSLHDSIQAAFFRGRFSALARKVNSVPGAMLAVACGEKDVRQFIDLATSKSDGTVRVACINSPESVTVSGDEPAINDLERMLGSSGVSARRLKVDTAYHSHHMEKIAESYARALHDINSTNTHHSVKFISSVTGDLKTTGFGASYWAENLVSQVRFSSALEALANETAKSSTNRDSANILIEIGPHSALQGPIRQTLSRISNFKYSYYPSLLRGKDAAHTTLSATAGLFQLGYPVSLDAILHMQKSDQVCHPLHDLPTYPWDHGTKHWHESRLSRDHRLRQFPYHDLLGLFDVVSTIHEPRWRYHVGIESLPWLSHHVVDGLVIWPGTAYICMALEATKQLSQLRNPESTATTFTLRDSEVSKAVVVPGEQANGRESEVEIQLVISRNGTSEIWESVRVLSCQPDGAWIENFSGLVAIDLALPSTSDDNEGVKAEGLSTLGESLRKLEIIKSLSHEAVDPTVLYSALREAGNDFGPSFTPITEAFVGKCVAFAKLTVPDMRQYMPKAFLQPHIIHPATLDTVNHLVALLFHRECSKAPIMPTNIAETTISADYMISPGEELIIACEITPEGSKSAKANTWIFRHDDQSGKLALVCMTTAIQIRAIGESIDVLGTQISSRGINSRISYHDDIEFLSNETFERLMSTAYECPEGNLILEEQMYLNERAAAIHLERALATTIDRVEGAPPHLEHFYQWITDFLGSELHAQLTKDLTTEAARNSMIRKSVEGSVTGKLLAKLGKHLREIIRGEVHSLSIMMEDGLWNKFYMDGALYASSLQAAKFIGLLAKNMPHMNILEIGAGTAGTTLPVLRALQDHGKYLLHRYCFTDISSGFFEQAKSKLNEWKAFLDFKKLDVARDPSEQDFELGSYDLIVAANVFHATKDVRQTLSNTRKLLKPGGRLVLCEITRPVVSAGVMFGSLSGWWEFEDGRKGTPLMSREVWQDHLLATSYSGIEFASYEYDGPSAMSSVMVSTAAESVTQGGDAESPSRVKILCGSQTQPTASLRSALSTAVKAKGIPCFHDKWDGLATASEDGSLYIVLDSADSPLLMSPPPSLFENIQSLVTTGRDLIWVSYHESENAKSVAMKGLATGMARVLRRENGGVRFITLDVQDIMTDDVSLVVDAILKLAKDSLWPAHKTHRSTEYEYTLFGSQLKIPRVYTDSDFDAWTERLNGTGTHEIRPFKDGNNGLKLVVETPGLLSSLCFAHDDMQTFPLKEDELQLEAKAYGVNFRDVFIALGQMPNGTPMSGEVAGIVTAIGSGQFVQNTYKIGDRVVGILGQAYSNNTRVNGRACHVLPDSIGFPEGVSLPAAYLTSYYCLMEIARLERGQRVLIHAASGGLGQSAIQLAQHIGAEVFVTAGSIEKRGMIADRYGIPDSHIFSSRGSGRSMKRAIMRLTKQQGVNVVVNSSSGEMLAESWECLGSFGYFFELGKTDIHKKSRLNMAPFDKSLTFMAFDLAELMTARPKMMYDLLGKVLNLVDQKVVAPVWPLNIVPVDQIESGFRMMAERRHMGKIIIEASDGAMVKTIPRPLPPLRLDADGTYVIAGGLGDLGRKLCCLIADFGARNIVTLSRRTLSKADQGKLEDEVRPLGAELRIVKCDITDRERVHEVAEMCRKSMPPIKGIIHGAMVLKDRPLVNMNSEDWRTPLGPKVAGTFNLDDAFSSADLDFFITLSSVSGIMGRPGQSNYSAGNCFQDAYIQQRNAESSAGYFTLNIGAITDSESITSMTELNAQQDLITEFGMTFDELYRTLQYAMDPNTTLGDSAQSIMGFNRQSIFASHDEFAQKNPFFSMLPYSQNEVEEDSGTVSKRDIETLLRNAQSIEEAAAAICEAIVDRFITFLNLSPEDVSLDQPLAQIGMDSLVSIELKNWMVRAFKANLQASELGSAPSILELSRTLASRSKYLSTMPSVPRTPGGLAEKPEELQPALQEKSHEHDYKCCRLFKEVPKLPLPDLESAFNSHMENVAHFAADEGELEDWRTAIKELTTPGSVAHKIHAQLQKTASDPNAESWAADHLLQNIHLKWRQGLHFASWIVLLHESDIVYTQAERAAQVATVAFEFKQSLDEGLAEVVSIFQIPQCHYQQGWIFNSDREPRVDCDVTRKFNGDFCAVLRRGRVFRVPLREGDRNVPYHKIKNIMESILETVQDEGSWAGILTSDHRDNWAKIYNLLLTSDPKNEEYFKTISEAAFVLNLDDKAPTTPSEQVYQGLFGDGFNRWYDKITQFIISANGKAAALFEHSQIDGMTPVSLLQRLNDAARTHPSESVNLTNGHSLALRPPPEVPLITTPEIDDHMMVLRQRYSEVTSQREFIFHRMSQLGKSFLTNQHMPIKGILDVVVQLAIRTYYGCDTEVWEGVSVAHYHKGRHDMIQTFSSVVADFCTSATDESIPVAERKDLMLRAANDISANIKSAGQSKGYFRLFNVIDELWPKDEPRTSYFDHPIYHRIKRMTVTSATLDPNTLGVAAMPANPSALRVKYNAGDNEVMFSIGAPTGQVEVFIKCLEDAATVVRSLILAA